MEAIRRVLNAKNEAKNKKVDLFSIGSAEAQAAPPEQAEAETKDLWQDPQETKTVSSQRRHQLTNVVNAKNHKGGWPFNTLQCGLLGPTGLK